MIAKLCVINTWSSVTKAKFQNSFVLSFFFLITFLFLFIYYLFIIILFIIIYLMLTFVTYKWNIYNLANTIIVKITTIFSIANLSQPDTLI